MRAVGPRLHQHDVGRQNLAAAFPEKSREDIEAGRFKIELTPRLMPVKNGSGQVDISATMQRITDQIEVWIRAAPERWLWVHRRWKDRKGLVLSHTRSAS